MEPTGSPTPDPGPPEPGPPDGSEETLPPGHLYRLAWVLYLAMALAGAFWLGWREGGLGLHLLLDPQSWGWDLAAGAAGGVALLGLWHGARIFLPQARRLEGELARVLSSIDRHEALALALISGFSEEVFFRGAVQGAFASHGWLWAALLFALLHTGPGPAFRLWTLFAFVAGLVFGGLTVWTGNLLAAVVAHVLVNGVNLRRLAASPDGMGSEGAEGGVDEDQEG